MLSPQLLKRLKDNTDFEEFTNQIISTIDELRNVSDLESMSDEAAGQEAKVRAKTIKKLQKIFAPVITFKQKEEARPEMVLKQKKKYAL